MSCCSEELKSSFSLKTLLEMVLQTEDEPVHVEEPEPEISVEEDAIDIDDGTASGRLSALRREIDTDSDGSAKSKDDISKRLDSFFSNR